MLKNRIQKRKNDLLLQKLNQAYTTGPNRDERRWKENIKFYCRRRLQGSGKEFHD